MEIPSEIFFPFLWILKTDKTYTEPNTVQDRQSMNNVTFRCIFVTIVAIKKQQVLHILSVHL
jgi:hypothetical protein